MSITDTSQLYPWQPVELRPPLIWPGHRPVAVAVIVLLEHAGTQPPANSIRLPGAAAVRVAPNLLFRSHREYGNRVGIFRILRALAEAGLPASVAVDAEYAMRYPFVIEACAEQGAEFVAHGIAADQPISSAMSATQERGYITAARDALSSATGQETVGWYGPEQSGSERTPFLLDELGFSYVCDWPNDEQPYLMNTPGRLVSVPTSLPLDDAVCVLGRPADPETYFRSVSTAFDVLRTDGDRGARSLVLVVRPWLTGRAYQIDSFERVLRHLRASDAAWMTTTGQLAAEAGRQLSR